MNKRTYPLHGKHTKNNHPATDPQFDFGIFSHDQPSESITIEDIQQETDRLRESFDDDKIYIGLFKVQPMNKWMDEAKKLPIPKMLFSEFWFEGEICILFGDTNTGKSILANQIGVSISSGKNVEGFKLEARKQRVIYFDFELSIKQVEARYTIDYKSHFLFNDNLIRAEINPDALISFDEVQHEKELYHSIESILISTDAKIVIFDNITFLKDETEHAKYALPLMKQLKALKNKYNLSLLALAHTPKRKSHHEITRNDLQGSKMLINFCDSAFAIGESHVDTEMRYIKQIKARNVAIKYDRNNVCTCKISKQENFLSLEFLEMSKERQHLKPVSKYQTEELEKNIQELLDEDPEKTAYAIAKELCEDEDKFDSFKVKVSRIVKRIRESSD